MYCLLQYFSLIKYTMERAVFLLTLLTFLAFANPANAGKMMSSVSEQKMERFDLDNMSEVKAKCLEYLNTTFKGFLLEAKHTQSQVTIS